MKKIFILSLILPNMVLAQDSVVAAAVKQEYVYVEVNASKLRPQPAHWVAGSQDLHYGDKLAKLSQNGAWLKVKTNQGQEGFVHQTAITSRKVVLKLGQAEDPDISADASDLVLAGKGFSKEVEENYSAKDSSLDFKSVNQLEQIKISEKEVSDFLVAGKLNLGDS